MRGFGAFLRKELRETGRTWRLWVLPGFIVFAAVSSPLITFMMPTLVESLGGLQQGFSISVPSPTSAGAYVEYLGNLGELVMFALVIAYGGIVSSEVRSGTAALALAKPLSRHAFVLAKWLSQLVVVVAAAVLGTALCVALTTVLLGTGPAAETAAAACLWAAYAATMLSAMVLLSVVTGSPAAAAGGGLGVYAAFAVLAQFPVTAGVSPAGLTAAGTALVQGDPATWVWPLLSAALVSGLCLAGAVWTFSRKEI